MQKFFMARGASLLSGGLIVVLCWLMAQWTWLILAPKAEFSQVGVSLFSTPAAIDAVVAGHLFGVSSDNSKIPEQQSFITSSNLKLHGVFAAIGSLPAFAIISVDGKPDQPFKVGAEITQELVLNAVYPDHVEMRRQGELERLDLENKSVGKNGVPTDSTEFNLNVRSQGAGNFSFSRNELNIALQNSKQLTKLGSLAIHPQGAGLAVNSAPEGSLANKLGLRQGDLILRVNGQAVTSMETVNRFYQQLNEVGQVRLKCLRNGQSLDFNYIIT